MQTRPHSLKTNGAQSAWPAITLVTPSYNQAAYLRDTIESVLDQKYPFLEYLVVDGQSTDDSVSIIREYEDRISWWVSEKDNGQSDALNKGFSRAKGDIIGWLNSDDVLLPNALWLVADAFRRNPSAKVFGGNYVIIDPEGRLVRCKRLPEQANWFARRGIFTVGQPGSFFQRELFHSMSGLNVDLHFNMDTDLYIRMLSGGAPYAYSPYYLSAFRVHPKAKTTAHKDLTLKEMDEVAAAWPKEISAQFAQSRWRFLYRLLQSVNGNYLKMCVESLKGRHRHWKEWSKTQPNAALHFSPDQ